MSGGRLPIPCANLTVWTPAPVAMVVAAEVVEEVTEAMFDFALSVRPPA